MKFYCSFLLILLLASSCTQQEDEVDTMAEAFVPVYMTTQNAEKITKEAPKPTTQAGKMYVFGKWLFQNDINKGIHIIDISDKANPRKISFISIPLSTEVAVKGNYLYTNNMSDLLTFNISDPANPALVKRMPNVFPLTNQQFPPFNGVAFECADPSKGVVINWERKLNVKANCRR